MGSTRDVRHAHGAVGWGIGVVAGAVLGIRASEEPQSPNETTGANDPKAGADAGDDAVAGKGVLAFSISVDASMPTIVQGGTSKLVVTVHRSADAEASGGDHGEDRHCPGVRGEPRVDSCRRDDREDRSQRCSGRPSG